MSHNLCQGYLLDYDRCFLKNFLTFILAAFLLFVLPSKAEAACASPAGVAGEIIYNADWHVPQYCNNTNWIGFGKATATGSAFIYKATNTTNSINARDVWSDGTYIYVADGAGGIDAYTFNGTAFTFKATNTTNSTGAQGVWGDGTYIYVADNTGGIDAYTFNGTAFTFRASNTTNSTGAQGVWGDGTYIYVADNAGGIDAYTFNGTAFTFLATNATSTQATGVWGKAGNIYVADFTGGIDAYRFNGTAFTFKATNTANSTNARDVWGDSTYVYVADGTGGGIDSYTFSCINPAGGEGDVLFNNNQGMMQYCNGTAWQAMSSSGSSSGGGEWKQIDGGDGGAFACGIKTNDTLWCWGDNTNGQLGDNTSGTDRIVPTAVNGGGTWKQVSAGSAHTCGIKTDNTLWCWGMGTNGRLGDNTLAQRLIPTAIYGGGTWKQVSAGNAHTCGIKTDDTLWCWGLNSFGQLGDNTTTQQQLPIAISVGSTWKQLNLGANFGCGIKTDDTLWCWGVGAQGQNGDSFTSNNYTPGAVSGGGTWKQVNGGNAHTCGIKLTDDTLWCWGGNTNGQIGDNTTTQKLIPTAVAVGQTWKQVNAGWQHTCGIKLTDNSLWCWGNNTYGELGDNTNGIDRRIPTAVYDGGTWKQTSSGLQLTCSIKADDTLWCWGNNDSGQLGSNTALFHLIPTAINDGGPWKQVNAGVVNTCGIKSDDTLWCWGKNASGEIGDNTIIPRNTPTAVNGGGTWKQVSTAMRGTLDYAHTCGIKTDDTLWCWGNNDNGRLGDGTSTQRSIPTAVNGVDTWKQVDTGYDHTCGIKLTGDTLWCWGLNANGQLGDGTTTQQLVPTAISGGGTWKQVSAGNWHTCGIKLTDDSLWCWGDNTYGQLGDSTSGTDRRIPTAVSGINTWKQVSLGEFHTCGIKLSDDSLWCWGRNINGQLGDNTITQRLIPTAVYGGGTWKEVSLGGDGAATNNGYTCGIKTDDTLWCWGNNSNDQLTATSVSGSFRMTGSSLSCANPFGKPGTLVYNSNFNVLQYCNGSKWQEIGR